MLSGLKTDLQLEIFAIAAGVTGDSGVGLITHNLEIITENDSIVVPITANILLEKIKVISFYINVTMLSI